MRGLCKKSMAVLLCLAMTFASLTMTTYGETAQSIWDGDAKTQPEKAGDVYQISSGAELAWFADYVNKGNSAVKAELKNDIDLGSKEWTPIGNNSAKFMGTFDGNGFAIHNMKIDCEKNYIGLFGYLGNGASVTDFSLDGSITSTYEDNGGYAAGVAGYAAGTSAKKVSITKIHNACNVSIKGSSYGSYAGGILGYAGTGIIIEDCSNSGTITGTQKGVGGIAGSAKTVKRCYNTGSVSGGVSVAGIAGIGSTETIENCYNTGSITGTNFVGGISAASNATAIPVVNCYNTGNIEIIGSLTFKDDIVASVGGVVKNCYTTGQKEDSAYGLGQCVSADELRSMADELGEAFACNLHKDYRQGLPVLTWETEQNAWKNLTEVTVNHVGIEAGACNTASVKYGTQMTEKMQKILGFPENVILETEDGNVSIPSKWNSETYVATTAGVYAFTPVYDMPSGGKLGEAAQTDPVQVTVREQGATAPAVTSVNLPENTPSKIVVKYGAEELGLPDHAKAVVDGVEKNVYIEWQMQEEFSVTEPGVYTATAYFPEEYTLDASVQMPQVQIQIKEQGYLGSLKFASASVGEAYEMTPVYDETVKTYTVWVPDTKNAVYCTAVLDNSVKSGTIQAEYKNISNKDTKKTLKSGTAENLVSCLRTGSATYAANANVVTITVTDTALNAAQTYTINFKRIRSISGIEAFCGDSVINYLPAFSSANHDYNADVSDTVTQVALDIKPLAKDSVLTVTAESVEEPISSGKDGKYQIPLSDTSESTKVGMIVRDGAGEGAVFYSFTINKVRTATVSFDITPTDAAVLIKDRFGIRVYEDEEGKFALMEGKEYSCTISKNGYTTQNGKITAKTETRTVVLQQAPENNKINKDLFAEWPNFGKNEQNNAIINRKTPITASGAALYWGRQLGSGYGGMATGAPLIVGGNLISTAGNNIYKLDRFNGEIVAQGTMCGKSNYSIVPPTYANGMIFVGLADGTIQAFDAQTLESLWIFRDELKGQPNSPIKYCDGYIYTGFWNSETKDANFVCVSVTDENPDSSDEAKYAAWTHTQAGGFYWAGAYACSDYVLVGTDDGASGNTSQTSELLSLNPHNGRVIDRISGLDGDIRSSVSYDDVTKRYYATSKNGSFYSFAVNADGTFKKDADGFDGYDLKVLKLSGMSTSTPLIYNGRAYVGISGKSQFSQNSGHGIEVIDLAGFTVAYKAATKGYPQTSGLLTTAYDEDGYAYIYFLDNFTPGWVRCLKDKPGVTKVVDPYIEVNADGSLSEYAPILFTPSGKQAQYAICTPIADEYGTLYFKNDSAYLMALGSNITKIAVEKQPDKVAYKEGEDFDASGMAVYAYFENGLKRDVTDYVKVISGEALEGGRKEVSICYDIMMYHDTEEVQKTVSGASIHASGVKLDALYTEVQITVESKVKPSTQPAVSEKPAASEEAKASEKPAASEEAKASEKPAASEEAKHSETPEESVNPVQSLQPEPTRIPLQKKEDGTFVVTAQACTVQAVGNVLDTSGSALLFMKEIEDKESKEYKNAGEVLKNLVVQKMKMMEMQFVDEQNKIITLNGKIKISFAIPEGYDLSKLRVARLKNTTIQDEQSQDYILYHTIISEDGRIASIETDALGTFAIIEADNLPQITLGDLNGDKAVKLDDAQKALKAALRLTKLTEEEKTAADVNHDGEITLHDAQLILKAALKLILLQ